MMTVITIQRWVFEELTISMRCLTVRGTRARCARRRSMGRRSFVCTSSRTPDKCRTRWNKSSLSAAHIHKQRITLIATRVSFFVSVPCALSSSCARKSWLFTWWGFTVFPNHTQWVFWQLEPVPPTVHTVLLHLFFFLAIMTNRNVSKCVDNGRQILLSTAERLNHKGQSRNYMLNGFIIIFKFFEASIYRHTC